MDRAPAPGYNYQARLGGVMENTGLKVLMVSSEVVPFAKSGGLGDMVSALSVALERLGHDVRVVLPRYYSVDPGSLQPLGFPLGVPLGSGEQWCSVYQARLPGSQVPVYFLDHQRLYGRDGIYGNRVEPDFHDNAERFALLCRGALQLCKAVGFRPDVVHAHDWPAALAPVYLHSVEGPAFPRTGSVLTIHNAGYQGLYAKESFPVFGLPWDLYHGGGFEFYGALNLLQAGLRNADVLTTVSPTYARELQTAEFGCLMDGLLRHRSSDLFGVLNGMDYGIWNPENDPFIPEPYSDADLAGKDAAKRALQETLGLPVDPGVPVVGMVTRLVEQKGLGDLCGPVHGSLFGICSDMRLQLVVLGTGERWCEEELASLAARVPNLRVVLRFDERLAHLIEAGSDFFLMPSRYEPCGLNQMYSLRYGTPPIVRRTGGLADTVTSFNEATGEGTGFVFDLPTPRAIYDTVGWAVWAYYNRPDNVTEMRRRAMRVRFEWDGSARRYVELYQGAIDRRLGLVPRTW
jgi:starch synthase